MEDRRTAIAVFLCIAIIMIYSEMVLNPYRQRGTQRAAAPAATAPQNPAGAAPSAPPSNSSIPSISAAGQAPAPAASTTRPSQKDLDAAQRTVIESDKIIVTLNLLGGRIEHFRLKEHGVTLADHSPLDMVRHHEGSALPLAVYSGGVNDDYVKYAIESTTPPSAELTHLAVPHDGDLVLKLRGTLPDGRSITKNLKFSTESYLFTLDVELSAPPADNSPLWIEWTDYLPNAAETHSINLEQFTLLSVQNKISHVLPPQVTENVTPAGNNVWISFCDKYFTATLIPRVAELNSKIGRIGNVFVSRVRGEPNAGGFTLYVGPKDYKTLNHLGFSLDRSIDLGWFSFLAYPLLWVIRFFYEVLGNYGLAIILLTLLIKALFLPLTKASFKSMQAMQDLQPEMKALRERIKDPTQLNQEMMGLYKKRGVNPMGGCLPMLIQLPVFLGLYQALQNSIEMRHAPFALWITDLSSPERLDVMGIGVPVMVLIMGASMFIQQVTTPTAADPTQRRVMLMMPIMFTVMFVIFPFPAGLVLYWLVNNLISIVQQLYLRGHRKANPAVATVLASIAIFTLGYMLTLL